LSCTAAMPDRSPIRISRSDASFSSRTCKREYQEFLQDHNRHHSDRNGRPDRGEDEIRAWARGHDLPYFDEQRGESKGVQRANAARARSERGESKGAARERS
jgi:hypothetical protein